MLTRWCARALVAALAIGLGCVLAAAPASADSVYCPPMGGACTVTAKSPGARRGTDDKPSSSGTGQRCVWAGHEVPCSKTFSDGRAGWFNGSDGCYYFRADPQPPAESPMWDGHKPGDGAVYERVCFPPNKISPLGIDGVDVQWLKNPPPGFGGAVSAATLAARAINRLPIRGPRISTAPRTNGSGLVGLPVWLWTSVSASTWGPASATASVPGLSVTATAHAVRIRWDMGDGQTVTCAGPGTPYAPRYGGRPSPTCGYVYDHASKGQPNGRYTVTGVTTWRVRWTGGGQSGVITVHRTSTSTLAIDELQVVTQ